MATASNEELETIIVLSIHFTVQELEDMLKNTKVGGYTAVRVEANNNSTNISVELR